MIKQSSRSRALASLFAAVAVIVLTVGFYGHVRAQSGVASARLLVPLRPVAPLSSVKIPAVFGNVRGGFGRDLDHVRLQIAVCAFINT